MSSKRVQHLAAWSLSLTALLLLGSCSVLNMAAGPDDFARNHEANLLKRSIDDSVRDEVGKKLPNGYQTRPYKASFWQEYWNNRIHHLGKHHPLDSYRGPSGPEWVEYIIRSRKNAGLRHLELDSRNSEIVRKAKLTKPSPWLEARN